MERILVTGGAGFIGSNLVNKLKEKGHEIIIIDNLSTGSRSNLSTHDGWISHDDVKKLEIGNINLDKIFHLGIPSSSPMYKDNRFLVGNAINDFIHVMELARVNDTKVVFASSSSVYGRNEPPHKEDMNIKAFDFYTEGRISMERIGKVYNELYDIEVFPMRFFSVYGPNERFKEEYANMVTQFYWWMKDGQRPIIYGDGEQTRDLTHVYDIVDACIDVSNKGSNYDIYNVGTGIEHSFNDISSTMNEVLGTDIEPKYVDNPIDNYVDRTKADISKIKNKIGWEPSISLKEGIEMMVNE